MSSQKNEWKKIPRLLFCAPASGSGKTVITCGLLKVLKRRGITAAAFKCGPDYIDPLFHREVSGVRSSNLDGFFQSREEMQNCFWEGCRQSDIGIIEGVMGFFDGLGGISSRASSWETAQWLDCPAILIVDGKGAGFSTAALVQGFLEFCPEKGNNFTNQNKIAGILFNRISPGMFAVQKKLLEERFSIPVFGFLPKLENIQLKSRHLGLVLPFEGKEFAYQTEKLAEIMEKTMDIEGLLEAAGMKNPSVQTKTGGDKKKTEKAVCRIGVAWDRAFCFYYSDNLTCLEQLGAELVFFSPLQDSHLPDNLDGLLLGGGYPELYAKTLSENEDMRREIAQAAQRGMPVLAECGGFLYLLETLADDKGEEYPMIGVLKGKGFGKGKSERFGYLSLFGAEDGYYLKKGECIRGHEFHYWDSTIQGRMGTAKKPVGGKTWMCMCQEKRVFAGFAHLYYPSFPLFPKRFVEQCKAYRQER